MLPELLLAIETSSPRGGVALALRGQLLEERPLTLERRHTAELLPAVTDLLRAHRTAPAAVGVVAYSSGPGSFTGLRIAATFARMFQSSTGCRVVRVPTLAVLACNAADRARPANRVAVLLEAKRGQAYCALYAFHVPADVADALPIELEPAALREPNTWLAALPGPALVLGTTATLDPSRLAALGHTHLPAALAEPCALQVARLGWEAARVGGFCPPDEILPTYLRRPECEEVYDARRAEARARRAREGRPTAPDKGQ